MHATSHRVNCEVSTWLETRPATHLNIIDPQDKRDSLRRQLERARRHEERLHNILLENVRDDTLELNMISCALK
jgi:hypothetical protein